MFTDASRDNVLQYAVIKNAYQGIVATEPSGGIKLTLNEVIIDHAYDAGLLGINTSIRAKNLLVSNCGKNIMLLKGGVYDFTHCTVASVSSSYLQHKEPVLALTNFLVQNGVTVTNHLDAQFRNSIFWGETNGIVSDEVVVLKQGNTNFNVGFHQVLWRVQNNPANVTETGIINQDPLFDSLNTTERLYSFRLKPGSPAIDKGSASAVSTDLDGRPRPVGLPDLGAYERQ